MEKQIDITGRYSDEINEMAYVLRNLRNGRIYGYNGNCSKGDGSLVTNIDKLTEELTDLIHKIEYGEESKSERLGRIFNLYIEEK